LLRYGFDDSGPNAEVSSRQGNDAFQLA